LLILRPASAAVRRGDRGAVQARKPKRHYTAGSGVAILGMLAHLPVGLRERLVKSVFGLG